MIRLALLGDDEQVGACLRLAPRVRGGSLTEIGDVKELDSDMFDAVVICSTAAPEDNCLLAAAHGKHVLLTTPPRSCEEATTLMQKCRAQKVRLMGGFSDRFLPSVQTIKRSLEQGQLGKPGLMRIHRWNSLVDLELDVSRDIDLAMWMFQAMPTEVYAVARSENVGYLQVHLGFPEGGMALIDVSDVPSSMDGYFSLSLIGSSGAAYADDHHNQQLLFRGEHAVALKTGQGQTGREGDAARLAQLQEFVDAITEEREPTVTGADAEAAMIVVAAAWQSTQRGRTARLSGEHYEC